MWSTFPCDICSISISQPGSKWGASTTGLEKRKNYEQIQDLQTESALFLMSRCIKWNTQPGVSGNC